MRCGNADMIEIGVIPREVASPVSGISARRSERSRPWGPAESCARNLVGCRNEVSVQAAIIDVLADLQRELDIGLLFVTHNLALIRTLSQEVAVMSEGRIVERGLVDRVLDAPQAEYTKKLLSDT